MLTLPLFETTAIVSDNASLAAQLSSLFTRTGRYLPVLDGPRMTRPDAINEVVRRRNALVMARPERVLLAGIAEDGREPMKQGWRNCTSSDDFEELAHALRGVVKRRSRRLSWGQTNLGVGVYLARLAKQELVPSLERSPDITHIQRGTHLLVACENGDELSQVVASNLAFACNASFAVFPALSTNERGAWLEELYSLEDGRDVAVRLEKIRTRARARLPLLNFRMYSQVLFITSGFPWGLAVPECPTTHMYDYPDFGRAAVEGLWAAQSPARSARTALLVDPQQVEGSEIAAINQALLKNGTLTRMQIGPKATVHKVQALFELLPFDIIVMSTHAGDAPGERVTYEYDDADGRRRRLSVDRAFGFSWDAREQKFLVQFFHRFHALDGVDWRDDEAKAALPVGSAITSWSALVDAIDTDEHVVHKESIRRVSGSMALQMNDHIWIVMVQGFAPGCAPFILNNACSSWHELSQRLTFAGARGYVGALYPVMDVEAQELGTALFGTYIGHEMPRALWLAQKQLYGEQGRRPYAMVGLPFTVIRPNTTDAMKFVMEAYRLGVAQCKRLAENSPHDDVRANAKRYEQFLRDDFEVFQRSIQTRARPPT